MDEQTRAEILRLYVPGVYGHRSVARDVGVSVGVVRRVVNPTYAEQQRRASRTSKSRRRGKCIDCGAETRYGGHLTPGAISERCVPCGARQSGLTKRGHGKRVEAILALLAQGPTPLREIVEAVGNRNATMVALIRLQHYGLVVKGEARATYALAERS